MRAVNGPANTVTYAARHAPCGTMVTDDLPAGYPVEEGVGLWCPVCRVSFWHVEADEADETEPEPEPTPPPAAATALAEAAPEAIAAVAAASPGGAPRRPRPRVWPVVALLSLA